MKLGRFSLLAFAAAATCATTVALAAPVNVSGTWRVEVASGSEFYSGVMSLNQVEQTIIGRAGKSAITGTMISDTKMDAKWEGPKGSGWMTFYFAANGNSFEAQWGFSGRKAGGKFTGKRLTGGATQ